MILPRPRHRQAEFETLQRAARARPARALARSASGCQVAVARGEHGAEIGRHLGVGRLQIDHLIALDHAEPQARRAIRISRFSWVSWSNS